MIVGGRVPVSMVCSENTASTAPAAVKVWPIIDLLDDSGMFFRPSPKTASMEPYSILSFSGVEVPWALI
ncbi:hypothetical protein D3C78_1909580 [compost metagenome]